MSSSTGRADFDRRVDTIEEAYEFFLAYASQGLPSDHSSATGQQIRQYLQGCDTALAGLGDFVLAFVDHAGLDQARYRAFVAVIERDARDAGAAIQLVLSLSAIGSQVIDNLNASIHLRALLTDLFLIDEVLKTASRA
ncbi:MAG: hypothetical protein AUJ01_06920 [Acidobacteria bacterium 13_1_40CM_3_65_5]|nr:MAG: hypothetical protein AUH72_11560 [Acidobacteria bacterium 13_1_40CM_4_65_8]OLD18795.1 MAG: hypothetical protein AUJ01_06920 [Acidobacteria bacterium 13_1_40CM_3_65_5]OLE82837.1 MAG: hypothetical protein AUF76_07960 [Acidobacteria bacterium 13_1_20CM_2_65_9]